MNLGIRRVGAPNERLALLLREWFRAQPQAVPAYAAFKGSLAVLVDHGGADAEAKDLVAVAAEESASTTGWRA